MNKFKWVILISFTLISCGDNVDVTYNTFRHRDILGDTVITTVTDTLPSRVLGSDGCGYPTNGYIGLW